MSAATATAVVVDVIERLSGVPNQGEASHQRLFQSYDGRATIKRDDIGVGVIARSRWRYTLLMESDL